MSQHALLSPARWSKFTLGQQILQIGVEMQRARSCFDPLDRAGLGASYERVLRLVDLTVEVNQVPNLRRELLRWRGVIAGFFVGDEPDRSGHDAALRVLLELHPESSPHVAFIGT